jgi:hypothetical protein
MFIITSKRAMLKLNGDLMIGCFKDATTRGIMNDKIKIRTGISWDIYIYICR